jgi:quercetin dioxygenase-like cupin family protein
MALKGRGSPPDHSYTILDNVSEKCETGKRSVGEHLPTCIEKMFFKKECEMKVVNMNQAPKMPSPDPLFTGTDVTRQLVAPDSKQFKMSILNFGKGVRNRFHAHDGEQILIVTAGKGIVATETEERVVTAGDIVFFPAGEKHWHGAAKDSEFSQLSVSKMGNSMTRLED